MLEPLTMLVNDLTKVFLINVNILLSCFIYDITINVTITIIIIISRNIVRQSIFIYIYIYITDCKYFEIFPKHSGYGFIAEFFALN